MAQANIGLLLALVISAGFIWQLSEDNQQLRDEKARLEGQMDTILLQLSGGDR